MQADQSNSADFSVATKLEAPVNTGETLSASVSMLAATTSSSTPPPRKDWEVLAEEDSSFFVPERCTALDDF